jgi:multidrug efflux pump subunit AcrB
VTGYTIRTIRSVDNNGSRGGDVHLKRKFEPVSAQSEPSLRAITSAAALVFFLGIAAIRSMPTDIFREIRIPVVTVIWQYSGLSTPEVEQRITTYRQYSISLNVNGIKDIEAQSLDGLSVQKIYF